MSTENRRSRLFIEPRMQGLLVFKILLYWVNGFLTIGLLLAAWSVFTDMPATSSELITNMWKSVGPALFASIFLMPLIVLDCIRWSNRYAGPMVRLHQSMAKLADGQTVEPLKFRDGDLWSEMANEFNRIAARLEEQSPREAATANSAAAAEELEPIGV